MFLRLLISSTFSFSILCAQEILSLDKIEVQDTYNVIEERKENSIAKRIIKGEELAQYGDMNALEMLKRTPGVTIAQGKGKKGAPGKGYTKVLIDGEEASATRRGNPLEQISPDMIERIEVMSNGSAEYTAESMGGIVNIVMKKPASEGKTNAKLTGGAYNGEPMASIFGQNEGKIGKLSYLVNTTLSDNSQKDGSFTQTDTYHADKENESRYRSLSLNTKLIYTASPKVKYMYDGAINRSDSRKDSVENRSGVTPTTIHQNDDGDALMVWSKFSGSHNISGTELLEWKLKYHENDSKGETSTNDGLSYTKQIDESHFRVFGGEGSYSKFIDEHFIKLGAEIKRLNQRDDVSTTGSTLTDEHQTLVENKGALYLQDEISLGERFIVTPGLRYERSVRHFDQSADIDYFAPSLHAVYKLSDNDNVRASVAKTVKLPRLDELSSSVDSSLELNDLNHPDVTGNPNLKEESAISYELRYEHFFEDKGIVSIAGLYRDISDKIEKLTTYNSSITTGRYVQTPENAGDGKLWSLELELKKSLDRYVSGLGIFGNATFQDTSLETEGVKRTIKGTNDYIYNIGFDHRLSDYRITYGAAYRYVSGYDDPMDQSGVAESQDGYGTLDFYVNKRLNSNYKWGLNLKNLTHDTIQTTSKRYDVSNGQLQETQVNSDYTHFHFLVTLEGKW